VYIWQNGDSLVADGWWNHYSWGMCTTSAECKTVITVVLMVMSGMDPHMISRTWDGFCWFDQSGFFRLWVGHDETPWCDRDRYSRRWGCYPLTRVFKAYSQPLLSACQTRVSPFLINSLHVIFFPHLLSSNHKSTQAYLYRCFRLNHMLKSKSRVPAGQRRRKLGLPLLRLCLWRLHPRLDFHRCFAL
jgi:hypothetical protein